MKHKKILTAYCLLLLTASWFFSVSGLAQESPPESLRLPEVVITGIDQTKIQQELPKVVLQSPLPEVKQSSRDYSDNLIQEGDLLYLANPQKAEQRYAKAIAFDPANSVAYLRLGDVYRALSQYSSAAKAYQDALEISENLPEAHYKLGILYESHLEDLEKAIEHYQAYQQLGGSDSRVRIWLRNATRLQEQEHSSKTNEEVIE